MGEASDPIRVVRVYFEGHTDSDRIQKIYKETGFEFGGWRHDDLGDYLRLIAMGDINPETLPQQFSEYGKINKIICEQPWPDIPEKEKLLSV
jgi:hypothetical protein